MSWSLLEPEMDRPETLAFERGSFFGGFRCVEGCFVFGSLARGEWDRWSDIDILLTLGQCEDCYWRLFAALCQWHHVIYHGRVETAVQPAGGCVLGIVLEGESVFHKD